MISVVMRMKNKKGKMHKKDKWANRMALVGVTIVVLSLAVVVNIKSASLKRRDLEFQIREENLEAEKSLELERKAALEERQVYVQSKQYIEEVAKEKLGLVNPDEILLKPSNE